MSRERLEALRKKKRLAELRAKQQGQGMEMPEQAPMVEEEKDPEVSQADAVLRGVGQGVTAEWLDEGIASYKTGKEVLGEVAGNMMELGLKGAVDAAPSISETYRKHKEDQIEHIRLLKEKYPMEYTGGNIAGMLLGSASTMGAGAALHGARVATSAKGAMGIMGGLGAIHNVGSSESDKLEDWMQEAKEGFAAGAVGELLAPGAQAIKNTRTSSFLKYLNVKPHIAEKALERFGKQVPEFVERVLNYTDEAGEAIFGMTKSRARVLDDVVMEEKIAGSQMGEVLNKIDTDFNLKIDGQDMYADVKNFVLDPLYEETVDPEIIKNIDSADRFLKSVIFENPSIDPKTGMMSGVLKTNPKLSASTLHRFKKGIYDKVGISKRSGDPKIVNKNLIQERIADRVGVYIDDMIANADDITPQVIDPKTGEALPGLKEIYANSRQKFGDLREARKLLEKSMTSDKGASILAGTFNDKIFTAAALFQTAGTGIPLKKSGMTAIGLKAVANHPGVNGVVANAANIVSGAIAKNPQAFDGLSRSIFSAAAISGEAFMEELFTSSAKVNLTLQPLARSTQEVIRRKDDILTMLHSKNPALASELGAAIESQNVGAIRQIMATHGQGKMIQQGIGWDGMAVTDQDKAAVQSWLQSVGDNRKRMYLTNQFGKDNMIPQEMMMPAQPEPMKQFIHRKRKDKVSKPQL